MIADVVDGIGQLTLTDGAILVALTTYAVQLVLDQMGWSRSSKTLRRENLDLTRRNSELEETVDRLDHEITAAKAAILALEEKVSDLQQRDQGAVLVALEQHERHANERHLVSTELLRELVGEVKALHEAA